MTRSSGHARPVDDRVFMRQHRYRDFALTAALCAALLAIPLSRADAEPNNVRLFLGVTHQQLDNTDAQVRAFTVVQDLLTNIRDRLPWEVTSRLGDVASWRGAENRRILEQLDFTHYLIAEPRVISEEGVRALEIKWHIGAFSPDKNRALDGWLKEKPGAARRVIFIPKLDNNKDNKDNKDDPQYQPAILTIKGEKGWETAGDKVVEDLFKVLKHVFPDMRTGNAYFIECIRDTLNLEQLKGVNMDLMTFLSGRLQTTGWSPTVRLIRAQAEEICADTEDRYKVKPNYHFEDADFLITGWLTWGIRGAKVRPSILVDDRVAAMRREYVARASEEMSSGEALEEFCAPPDALLQTPVVNKLVEYIRSHGLKAGTPTQLQEEWKCGPGVR